MSHYFWIYFFTYSGVVVLPKVLDWLQTHGEVFLQKNPGIGRNLAKARMYQKSHEHFENVAQVTLN